MWLSQFVHSGTHGENQRSLAIPVSQSWRLTNNAWRGNYYVSTTCGMWVCGEEGSVWSTDGGVDLIFFLIHVLLSTCRFLHETRHLCPFLCHFRSRISFPSLLCDVLRSSTVWSRLLQVIPLYEFVVADWHDCQYSCNLQDPSSRREINAVVAFNYEVALSETLQVFRLVWAISALEGGGGEGRGRAGGGRGRSVCALISVEALR